MWSQVVNQFDDFYQHNGWMMKVFIIVLLTLILHASTSFVLNRLIKKSAKTKNFLDETFLTSLHRPLGLLIWLIGICFAAEITGSLENSPAIFDYIPNLRKLGVLLLVTWFFSRFIKSLEINYLKHADNNKKTIDKTLVHAGTQLITISIFITSLLIGMQLFGVPISGLLAFGGIGGAGIAFASKDLLANFFGGIIVYLDRPFKVGDWIRSPDRNIEGTVEYIGWRVTRIRTFNKRPLYVPNGVFLTISVENPARMTNRRIKTLIGVRYDDAAKIATLTSDIKSMLQNHPEIDTKMIIIVNLVEFAASSLNILVYTFTKTTNWVKFQEVQQDVFLKIIDIVESHEAQCAFPTTTIHLPENIPMQ